MNVNLKEKIISKSEDELRNMYELQNEYTEDAKQILLEELERRGLKLDPTLIIPKKFNPTESENENKNNWWIIGLALIFPFTFAGFSDIKYEIISYTSMLPAISLTIIYIFISLFVTKFPKSRKLTHYSIIYFLIWVFVVIKKLFEIDYGV